MPFLQIQQQPVPPDAGLAAHERSDRSWGFLSFNLAAVRSFSPIPFRFRVLCEGTFRAPCIIHLLCMHFVYPSTIYKRQDSFTPGCPFQCNQARRSDTLSSCLFIFLPENRCLAPFCALCWWRFSLTRTDCLVQGSQLTSVKGIAPREADLQQFERRRSWRCKSLAGQWPHHVNASPTSVAFLAPAPSAALMVVENRESNHEKRQW